MRKLDLGRLGYAEAWDIQKELAEAVIGGAEDTLVFVEHNPVLTLGASFHESNLLLPLEKYAELGIDVCRTDRGGDVTYHGPGQLVIYPIFDLRRHGQDLHRWMRDLEEAVIQSIEPLGLSGVRFPPHTGVWVGHDNDLRKVAAIGVKVRKWVNLHGIALNCDNDLSSFELIVPCGIKSHGVTSLTQELKRPVPVNEVQPLVESAFASVFTEQARG